MIIKRAKYLYVYVERAIEALDNQCCLREAENISGKDPERWTGVPHPCEEKPRGASSHPCTPVTCRVERAWHDKKHGLCGKGSVWKRGWEQNCEKGLENQLRNLGFIQYAGGAKKRLDSVNCAF